MWEIIKEPARGEHGNPERKFGLEERESHRLKVPGGWLVRTTVSRDGQGGAAVHQIFLVDMRHEWKLE